MGEFRVLPEVLYNGIIQSTCTWRKVNKDTVRQNGTVHLETDRKANETTDFYIRKEVMSRG